MNEERVLPLFLSLTQLKHIISLKLYLQKNCLGERGIEYLFLAISQLKNISILTLNLGYYFMYSKGMEVFS